MSTVHEQLDLVSHLIVLEMGRAERLHGPIPADMERSMLILMEEVGEATAEALDLTRACAHDPYSLFTAEAKSRLSEELVQVAATAIRMIYRLEVG